MAIASENQTWTIALIGNPNTGKSTLFGALSGSRQRVGNYPGVTVEKKLGEVVHDGRRWILVDLPGTYSLAPRSPDEMVAVDVLLGRRADVQPPDVVICVVSASNLARNLYLVSQVLELGRPVVVALSMGDLAEADGLALDVPRLRRQLGVPVVSILAQRGQGLEALKQAVEEAGSKPPPTITSPFPAPFREEVDRLAATLAPAPPRYLIERLLLDAGSEVKAQIAPGEADRAQLQQQVDDARDRLAEAGCRVPGVETTARYAWIAGATEGVVEHPEHAVSRSADRLDAILTHKVWGSLILAAVLLLTFSAVFAWAEYPMGWIDAGFAAVSNFLEEALPDGPIRSLLVYDRPTKFAAGLEQKIVDEVHRQLPSSFAAPKGTEGVPPRTPADSARSLRTREGLEVELVAAEPLVTSPVAIDWSADGKLWVCEMCDYPTGADGNWRPGGRVVFLESSKHDGRYDKSTTFLENIPFPTGITAYGKGVLVCAAPDILYAEDTDGDGKADKVEKLFSGFPTENYQARVNSITLGLDNWLYAANGLLGGNISDRSGHTLDIRGRDFRFRTLNGPLETVTGITQQGRVRDDAGHWFGCNNSVPVFLYPHEDRYLRRNPHAPSPDVSPQPPAVGFDGGRVFPASRILERFNDPNSAGRVTSACGIGIYRDTLLGQSFYNNAFVCEPVHNLVHRMVLTTADDGTVTRHRADGEAEKEFLASTDNWTRPVQVRTGPDGALYVVDMYRFLIEHPRWIPAERLAQLDVRAGANMGRIYRIRPAGDKLLREIRDLTKLNTHDLAAALDTPNGTDRDRVHLELLLRNDNADAIPLLDGLAERAASPQVRLQALCALEGINGLNPDRARFSLNDPDPDVRRHALRLCEPNLKNPATLEAVTKLTADPSHAVRHQLALTLGQTPDPRAGAALAKLAAASLDDADLRLAILSSATPHVAQILAATVSSSDWVPPLIATAAATGDEKVLASSLAAILPKDGAQPTPAHFTAIAALLDARPNFADATIQPVIAAARKLAADDAAAEPDRLAALRLLGRGTSSADELDLLARLATASTSDAIRAASLTALRRQTSPDVATRLLANWRQSSPSARTEIVSTLLARDDWALALLGAIDKRTVNPQEISLTDRQQLTNSKTDKIRDLATKLYPPTAASARADVVKKYASVATLTGTPAAEVFAKNCATCHQLGGVGHPVGPDLSVVRGRDAAYLVKNILDPNAVVEPRFINYQVILSDNRRVLGVIQSESPTSVTVASSGGATETLPRASIKEIRATGTSLMPEGLEATVSPQQMADLIAYLRAFAPRKQFPGNAPALIAQAADGSLILPASKADILGNSAVFETEFKNVGYWSDPGDTASWDLRVDKPADFDAYLDYACNAEAAGNAFTLEVATQSLPHKVAATAQDWSVYKQIKLGTLHLPAGQHRLTVRPTGDIHNALMDLRTIALVPAGKKPKWPAAKPAAASSDGLARTPAEVAAIILNPASSDAARTAAISSNPQFSSALITELTRDLPEAAESQRIPWIWRVAINAGRRNQPDEIKRILAVSLPTESQPLRDWQAVVLGGGIINGISQQDVPPAPRLTEILHDDASLRARYDRTLSLAAAMADDARVPDGTRYDALRILGVAPSAASRLSHYLDAVQPKDIQHGAAAAILDLLAAGLVKPSDLPPATAAALKSSDEPAASRAKKLLP